MRGVKHRLLREGIALTFNPSISCLHAPDLSLVKGRERRVADALTLLPMRQGRNVLTQERAILEESFMECLDIWRHNTANNRSAMFQLSSDVLECRNPGQTFLRDSV